MQDKSGLTDETMNLIIDFLGSLEDTFLTILGNGIVELGCFFVNFKQPEFQAECFSMSQVKRSSHL